MHVRFCLAWIRGDRLKSQSFKLDGARAIFGEYVKRISKFAPCSVAGLQSLGSAAKTGSKIWVCERNLGAKELSSEEVAQNFKGLLDSGARQLSVVIGGSDGFSKEELDKMKPALRWSFGPITLPHELAAVIASEQIYRAWTILHRMPYHSGH